MSDTARSVIARGRELALDLFRAGLEAADPKRAVELALANESLDESKTRVVAFGKAACSMASAIDSRLLSSTPEIVVVNDENARPVDGFRVFESGHPLPDARGAAAALEVEQLAQACGSSDTFLVLISGGGSAILPAPATETTLEDKMITTRALLRAGADIHELNTVRKHLSS
ncbi:MAG: glycerate-2-kinase family protein, partial [Planctomycetota bacterium]